MALTPTEKQRRYRQRLKEKAAENDRQLRPTVFKTPFSDYLASNGINGYAATEVALGQAWWDFTNDAGFTPFDGEAVDDDELQAASNSHGRADRLISVLEDFLSTLTEDLNAYKRAEIDARVAEIEQADLSNPEAKQKALADIVQLQKMRDQLGKQVRWTFPQWKVTGE